MQYTLHLLFCVLKAPSKINSIALWVQFKELRADHLARCNNMNVDGFPSCQQYSISTALHYTVLFNLLSPCHLLSIHFSLTELLLASQNSGINREMKDKEETTITLNQKTQYSTQHIIRQPQHELFEAPCTTRWRERMQSYNGNHP